MKARSLLTIVVVAAAVLICNQVMAVDLEIQVEQAKAAYEANPNPQTKAALDTAVAAFSKPRTMPKVMITEAEPNDAAGTANAIAGDEYVLASITPIGDFDWFVRSGNDVDDVIFAACDATISSSGTDVQFNIYANDGTTLIEFDDDSGPSLSSCIGGAIVPQAGGIYYVPNEYQSNGEIALYAVQQAVLNTSVGEVEPNDDTATATPVSASDYVTGSVPPGDTDWFSFPAEAGDVIIAIVDEDPNDDDVDLNSNLAIMDTDGTTVLATGDNSSSADNDANCAGSVVAVNTGLHYVRIHDYSTSTDVDYRFVVLVNGEMVPVELQSFSLE